MEALVELERRAELLEREEVRVDATAADDVAARRRQLDLAAAREQRPGEQDRRADLPAELGIELADADASSRGCASVLRAVHSASTPTDAMSSTSVSTSRMRGTFSSVTGCSERSAAATIGSAAFLLPEGRMVPESVCPPSTTNCSAVMSSRRCVGSEGDVNTRFRDAKRT